jgi:flagellar basal-body rod modification protein FlgD
MSVGSIAGEVLTKPSSSTSTKTVPSTTTASAGATQGVTKENPKETFLTLLVAQLQHQDPLAPQDNAQFTAQLAQFTSLEQLQNMNTKLSTLTSAQTTTNNLQAATLLGKEVQAQNDTVRVQKQGGVTPFTYNLATDSATVQIEVLDQSGSTVRIIQAGAQKAGSQNLAWNGKDTQGKTLPEGAYHFKVTAQDKAGKPVAVDASLKGIVDEVAYDGKQPYVVVGGNQVDLTAITDVKQSK